MKFYNTSREEIEAWPVAESGLPERVLNCARSQGVSTVGQLRKIDGRELLHWWSLGKRSLKDVELFFDICQSLEKDEQRFSTVLEVMKFFLTDSEMDVIYGRYGLDRRETEASRNYYTLQQLANQRNVTRERIRQIESDALRMLSMRMPSALLAPFRNRIVSMIDRRGGIANCAAISGNGFDFYEGVNPCATTLLLADLQKNCLDFIHNVFTSVGRDKVERVLDDILGTLRSANRPLDLSRLPGDFDKNDIAALLWGVPNMLFTRDGSAIYSLESLEFFLKEVFACDDGVVHYEELTEEVNKCLDKHSRKGTGFFLQRISSMASVEKIEPGRYVLRSR